MKYMKQIIPVVAIIILLIAFSYIMNTYMIIKVDDSTSIQYIRLNDGMKLTFGPGGINAIYGIESFEYYDNIIMQVLDQPQNQFISASDWIGPMVVSALEGGNTSNQDLFTGGWHGSNGDDTGKPTAKSIQTLLLADGKPIDKNGYFLAKQLTIEVTNHIMAYNTDDRYVIEEAVYYTIDSDKKIEVQVELKALENLRIERYYGLQIILPDNFNKISYIRKENVLHQYNQLQSPYNASDTPVDEMLIEDIINEHRIITKINLDSDINNFVYKAEEEPYAFTTNDRKSYFNIVNGKVVYLKKNEVFQWNGSYQFE